MEVTADITYADSDYPLWQKKTIRTLEYLFGKKTIEDCYRKIPDHHAGKASFFTAALEALAITTVIDQAQINRIPKEGPLVFIANHPFGVIDGIILCYLAASHRDKWGVLIYDKISEIDHLTPYFLPVSWDSTEAGIQTNIQTKKKAISLLKEGGAVVIFPAGGVSKPSHFLGPITDVEWKLFAAKLIKAPSSTVIPVFFHGNNSWFYYAISHISDTLRLGLIVNELKLKQGATIRVSIGDPIKASQLVHIKGRKALLDHIRSKVYYLANQDPKPQSIPKRFIQKALSRG